MKLTKNQIINLTTCDNNTTMNLSNEQLAYLASCDYDPVNALLNRPGAIEAISRDDNAEFEKQLKHAARS